MASLVNSAQGSNYTGTLVPSIAAGALTLTAGNLVVVLVRGGTSGSSGVTDTRGNTYVQRATDGGTLKIYSCSNCVGGSSVVTAAFSPTTNYVSVVVLQFFNAIASGEFIGAFTTAAVTTGTTIDLSYNLGGVADAITVGIADVFASGSFGFSVVSSDVTGLGYTEPVADHNSASFFYRTYSGALSSETVRATCTVSGSQKNLLVAAFKGVSTPFVGTKYFMNGGVNSNWSDDTNWSQIASSGPNDTTHAVNGDTAILNAGSPACTINVASACTSIVCTGYTNTLTVNANLTTAGNVTLASGMTITGTGDLIGTVAGTWTSAGKTWSGGLQFTGANATQYTFSGNWSCTGLLTCSAVGSTGCQLSGGNLTTAGGLLMTGHASVAISPITITMTGGTWSGAGKVLHHLTFAGNVTISGTVNFSGFNSGATRTLTYTSGTLTTTGSTVTLGIESCVLNLSTAHLDNLTITNSTPITLSSALNVDGTLTTTSASSVTVNGAFPITCGTLVLNNSSGNVVTFNQSLTCTGNASAGSLGTSVAGSGSITVNGNLTISSVSIHNFNLPTTVVGSTNFTATSGSQTLNGVGLTTGGLSVNTVPVAGSQTIIFGGTGTWSSAGGTLSTNVTINTAGTLTLSGTIPYATGTIRYIAGTIAAGTSILSIASGVLNTVGMTWANVTLTGTAIGLVSNLSVSGTLLLPNSDFTFTKADTGRVNSTSAATWTSATGTTYASAAISHTAGNTIVAVVGGNATAGQTVLSVTDTAGNTYTKVDHAFEATDKYREEIWYAKNITGHASNVVTVTWSATIQYRAIAVAQYPFHTVTPFDGTAKGTSAAASTSVTTSTLTTTRANGVHILVPRWGAAQSFVFPTEFNPNFADADDPDVFIVDRLTDAFTGTYTITNSTAVGHLALVAAFVLASAITVPNITCGTLTSASLTATRTVTFIAGSTITITAAFTSVRTGTVRWVLKTDAPGSTAQFVLQVGATQSVSYTDPTDLDASAGQTINATSSYITNSLNWFAPLLQGRVTQQIIETLSFPYPDARVTQSVIEVLSITQTVTGRVTQVAVEVLSQNPIVSTGMPSMIWLGDGGGNVWIE